MNTIPKPFEVYRHFKGNFYQIINIAEHSENGELMVVYQQLYSPYKMFVRPLDMFCSKVDREKYPAAKQEYRFQLQTELPHLQNEGLYEEYQKKEKTVETTTIKKDIVVRENRKITTFDAEKGDIKSRAEKAPEMENLTLEQLIEEPEASQYDEHKVTEEEASLHPMLLQFLDADSYEEKLNILNNMHREITDSMINTMAVSLDVEVHEGDIEDRYREIMNCLVTMEKFECNRLR